MRSVLNPCLVTVGVVLMAANTAEALTMPAAAAVCAPTQQAQSGPCAIAGGALIAIPGGAPSSIAGGTQTPLEVWDWYEAVLAREGRFGGAANGFSDGSVAGIGNRDLTATDVGIYAMGPSFSCAACFLENGSGANSSQNLFNLGAWNGTDATQPSGLYSGFFAQGSSAQSSATPGSMPFAPTPEPGTMGLVMVGLALLAGPLRRLLRGERK